MLTKAKNLSTRCDGLGGRDSFGGCKRSRFPLEMKCWCAISAHLVLFAFLLILAASVLFIVEHPYTTSTSNGDQPVITNPNSEPELTHYTHYALWSASISLAISLTAMTVIALLNLPLDRPKTLIINSRWIRLAPRIPALAVICCLPLSEHLSGAGWCGGVTTTLYAVFLWEWIAGMERNWKLLEPIAESEN